VATVNAALCQSCGACGAACRNKATVIRNLSLGQLLTTVEAMLAQASVSPRPADHEGLLLSLPLFTGGRIRDKIDHGATVGHPRRNYVPRLTPQGRKQPVVGQGGILVLESSRE
jgi:hypothetical protein